LGQKRLQKTFGKLPDMPLKGGNYGPTRKRFTINPFIFINLWKISYSYQEDYFIKLRIKTSDVSHLKLEYATDIAC
jgi:hypothetical protein